MNKKAETLGNQLLIFVFLVFIVLVGVGISSGVYIFFSADQDFRQVDAAILNKKITDCLTNNEIISPQQLSEPTEKFYKICALNKQVIENYFTLSIELNDLPVFKLKDSNLCALSNKNKQFPICESSIIQTKQGKIKITSGSVQQVRKVLT